MVRPLRIEYPGALYHVMSRGNAYQDIYLDNNDRVMFLKNLEHFIKIHNLVCYAFCLMDNHYHLLIETPDGNLSKAMRDINGSYTQQFNKRHERVGHVLQGRYKAYVIEKDVYLLEVARYIVNNPVEAEIVAHPKDWRWSSYTFTAGARKPPDWLETNFLLGLFAENRRAAERKYRQFVKEGIERGSPYNDVREGIILGSPQFSDWIWNDFQEKEEIQEVKKSERMISRPSLEDLFFNIQNKEHRDSAIKMARIRAGYSVTEIANHLEIHRTTVSRILNS